MKYYLAGLSAFVLWGFSSLAVRPLSAFPSLDILFYRVLFAFVIMILVGFIFRPQTVKENLNRFLSLSREGRFRVMKLTFLGGVFLMSNWFFFIFIINRVNVKAASFSYLICPIVTMVLASVFLRERLTLWQWGAVGLSAVGCWLLSLGHWEDLIYSLIVAFSYGAYLVSQRANRGFDSLIMLTFHIGLALIFLAVASFFYSFRLPREPYFYQYMSILVIVLTILPLALNLIALKGVSSSSIGMLLYANPVINFVMAVTYFGEEVSRLQIASYAIIVLSIVLFNKDFIWPGSKKLAPTDHS